MSEIDEFRVIESLHAKDVGDVLGHDIFDVIGDVVPQAETHNVLGDVDANERHNFVGDIVGDDVVDFIGDVVPHATERHHFCLWRSKILVFIIAYSFVFIWIIYLTIVERKVIILTLHIIELYYVSVIT